LNPHLDSIMTDSLLSLIEKNQVLFVLWVFNYKKAALEDKFIKVKWDGAKEAELNESIRKTVSLVEMYDEMGWPAEPNYKFCKNCPVAECADRITHESI